MLTAFLHQDHSWNAYQKKKKKISNTKAVRPVAKIAEVAWQEILKRCCTQETFPAVPPQPPGAGSPRERSARTAAQLGCRAWRPALVQKAPASISSKRKIGTIWTTGKSAVFPPCTLPFCLLQPESRFLYMGMCFSLCIWTTGCIDLKWKNL